MSQPSLSKSDWSWIRKQVTEDAPVPYDAADLDDGPYDPNDDEAVDSYLTETNRVYPASRKSKLPITKAS